MLTEPNWLSVIDGDRRAYLRERDKDGWPRWTTVGGTEELLTQIIRMMRAEKPEADDAA